MYSGGRQLRRHRCNALTHCGQQTVLIHRYHRGIGRTVAQLLQIDSLGRNRQCKLTGLALFQAENALLGNQGVGRHKVLFGNQHDREAAAVQHTDLQRISSGHRRLFHLHTLSGAVGIDQCHIIPLTQEIQSEGRGGCAQSDTAHIPVIALLSCQNRISGGITVDELQIVPGGRQILQQILGVALVIDLRGARHTGHTRFHHNVQRQHVGNGVRARFLQFRGDVGGTHCGSGIGPHGGIRAPHAAVFLTLHRFPVDHIRPGGTLTRGNICAVYIDEQMLFGTFFINILYGLHPV